MIIQIDINNEHVASAVSAVFDVLVREHIGFTVIPAEAPPIVVAYGPVNDPERVKRAQDNIVKRVKGYVDAHRRKEDEWAILQHGPCPLCNAAPGHACLRAGGRPAAYAHAARARAYYERVGS